MDYVFVFSMQGEDLYSKIVLNTKETAQILRKILFGVGLLRNLFPMHRSRLRLGRDSGPHLRGGIGN